MRKEYGGMGFRDFYGFNLAMLGKQGWRLTTNQDAIISRVFKAKYYPKTGFLEARLGHNPSFVWRSIHSSQAVVKEDGRWCIGDGRNINVWQQPWLRSIDNAFVSTQPPPGLDELKVSDLIHESTKEWNTELVQQVFDQRDVQEILKIPLSHAQGSDSLLWRLTRNGAFSVKSAYHHLMEHELDSHHLRVPGPWKEIWKLNIPNRVRVFLWWAARGVLPSKQRLRTRGVLCDPMCVHCQTTEENDWHVFFGCSTAREVWIEVGLWNLLQPLVDAAEGFFEMLCSIFRHLSAQQQALVAMSLWCLWGQRNSKVWDNASANAFVVARRAISDLEDWQNVRTHRSDARSEQRLRPHSHWVKPRAGWVSCNVDAAMFNDQNCYGIGMCLRNDSGDFVAAITLYFYGSPTVMEAEATGLLEAITWLRGLNIANVSIELDCLPVVEGMKGNGSNRTECDSIISRCKLLWSSSNNFGISFVRRQANRVAHALASV